MITQLHKDLQDFLWAELQCNPNYNRSISFVFLKQIINKPMTDKEYLFSQAFQSKLKPDYLYNLDKGDLKELYTALIYAGKQIDTLINHQLRETGDDYILPLVEDYNTKFLRLRGEAIFI